MRVVLPAVRAELLHLEALGGRFLVLGARIVPVFAFLTLERYDFSRHFLTSFLWTCGYQPRSFCAL
jgi:hypothetical protein